MNKSKTTLLIIYNSFNDPLFQNLIFPYISTLSNNNFCKFNLITFEQKKYSNSFLKQKFIKTQLLKKGIIWYPLKFRTDKFLLLKKFINFFELLILVYKIIKTNRPKLIFSFTNIAGSFGILISKIYNIPHLVYSYEPHSSFMYELGLWSNKSLNYIFLNAFERYLGKNSKYVLTGTKYMVNTLIQSGAKGKIFRAPSSVDENLYCFSSDARNRIRNRLNMTNKTVLLYLGKFGNLYYDKEIIKFFQLLHKQDSRFFFLIVTPSDKNVVHNYFGDFPINNNSYHVTEAYNPKQVIEFISSSDIGLTAIPPTPSQKYRSPLKTSEYLLCGLPYITCNGISEDSDYARDHNIGLVIDNLDSIDVSIISERINSLLLENKNSLRTRCREIGLIYRSKSNVDKIFFNIFNQIFSFSQSHTNSIIPRD